jgi:hypothetical protein
VTDEQLNGRQLDAAIAEHVMGWRRRSNGLMHGKAQEVFIDDRGNTFTTVCGCAEDFHPSESVEDALQVVEIMLQKEWTSHISTHSIGPCWTVEMFFTSGKMIRREKTESDSLPEAICKCALAAVED